MIVLTSKLEFQKRIAEKGLTLNTAAQQIGVSRVTLQHMVDGDSVRSATAKVICDWLDVKMWDYFSMTD